MSAVAWERDARRLDGDLRLDGAGLDVIVGDGIVSFDEELSFAGSSIVRIGVLDPDRVLVDSGIFELSDDEDEDERPARNVELTVDGVAYWLRAVAKRGDVLQLAFEDRTVCRLRDTGEVLLADYSATDHRTFIRRLCKLAGVDELVLDEPGERERRASGALTGSSRGKRARALAEADDRRAEGIDPDVRLRVRSTWGTSSQLDLATRLLTVARKQRASEQAMRALIAVAIERSGLRHDTRAGEDGRIGVLQVAVGGTSHAGRVTRPRAADVEFVAEAFLRDPGLTAHGGAMSADRRHRDWTIGEIARHAAGGRASSYDRWARQARAIVDAFKGEGIRDQGSERRDKTLTVVRGESYWDAAVRVGELNDFVFFAASNKVYYLPARTLRGSRARMRIGERTPGVHTIDWEWAPRKQLPQVELVCDVYEWDAPPGSIIVLDRGCGPAAGRWMVSEYRRSRYSHTAQVTLVRMRPKSSGRRAAEGGRARGAAVGGGYFHPLSMRGELIGRPGEGRHRGRGVENWQGRNAIDLRAPAGTPVTAVRDGRVVALGDAAGSRDRPGSLALTLATDDGKRWYYDHLRTRSVKRGAKVRGGAQIGTSGTGDGIPHLHVAVDRGDPLELLKVKR
jgi:murein DD-endopeptidase MepM/ murein hydrolase activator NlpD